MDINRKRRGPLFFLADPWSLKIRSSHKKSLKSHLTDSRSLYIWTL